METQNLFEKYHPFLKNNFLPLILGLFGLIIFIYGLIALLGETKSSDNEIVFESGEHFIENQSQIKVDVAGGVINPGVYGLAFDARMQDGLVAAGGLSEDADRDWIAKNLNLAQKLVDGTKIYIPKIGDRLKRITDSTGITSTTGPESGQINVNTAGIEALDGLPGVGPVTAQKIIDGRPYNLIDELLSRKIVGAKVFGEIKEKITVY